MKNITTTILLVVSLALSVILTFAIGGCSGSKEPAASTSASNVVSAVCPVMGSKIPDITKAAGKSVYKGKTYYFCCDGCKPLFDKDPAKYVK